MEPHQVLIAEDESMLRVVAAEMLEEAGFRVFQAGDGAEALALLKIHHGIALLISDIKMPGMGGYALAEAAVGFKPDLKLLMMTGYSAEPRPPALEDRHVRILRKPFNLDRLCELTQAMIRGPESERPEADCAMA
ncbi:MAG: response regulator [Rhizomicrobium sp.]